MSALSIDDALHRVKNIVNADPTPASHFHAVTASGEVIARHRSRLVVALIADVYAWTHSGPSPTVQPCDGGSCK